MSHRTTAARKSGARASSARCTSSSNSASSTTCSGPRAVEGRRQEGFYHSLITAAQAALGEEDHHEAERQANQALKLRPGDPVAAHLLSQAVRNKRQKEFDNAMAAANAALARGNHDEAERQANLALKGQPGDQAALQILSQAKENRVARESEMDLEPPTAPTSSGAHGDRDTAVPPPPSRTGNPGGRVSHHG